MGRLIRRSSRPGLLIGVTLIGAPIVVGLTTTAVWLGGWVGGLGASAVWAGLLGYAISRTVVMGRRRRMLLDLLEERATALDLTVSTEPGGVGGADLRVVLGGRGLLPDGVRAQRLSGLLPGLQTGDELFDRNVHMAGRSDRVLGALDHATRRALIKLVEYRTAWAGSARLEVEIPARMSREVCVHATDLLADVAALLRARPDELPAALLVNARQDPIPLIRARNRDALFDRHADSSQARELARELLVAGDLQVALRAAQVLGLTEEEQRILALVEGSRGSLSLQAPAEQEGRLSPAGRQEGALSHEPGS